MQGVGSHLPLPPRWGPLEITKERPWEAKSRQRQGLRGGPWTRLGGGICAGLWRGGERSPQRGGGRAGLAEAEGTEPTSAREGAWPGDQEQLFLAAIQEDARRCQG